MEFSVWESQTNLLYCLPLDKILPYRQYAPEKLFFSRLNSSSYLILFVWQRLQFFRGVWRTHYVSPVPVSPELGTALQMWPHHPSVEGKDHFSQSCWQHSCWCNPGYCWLFLLQGHTAVSRSAWYFDFPHPIPAHFYSLFIPPESHIPASTSCMFYFHVEAIGIILFIHAGSMLDCSLVRTDQGLEELVPGLPSLQDCLPRDSLRQILEENRVLIWSPAFCLVSFLQDLELHHLVVAAARMTPTFTPLTSSSLFITVGCSRTSSLVDSWIFRKADWRSCLLQ